MKIRVFINFGNNLVKKLSFAFGVGLTIYPAWKVVIAYASADTSISTSINADAGIDTSISTVIGTSIGINIGASTSVTIFSSSFLLLSSIRKLWKMGISL